MDGARNWRKWLVLPLLGLALSARSIGCDYSTITEKFGAEAVERCSEKCPFQVCFAVLFQIILVKISLYIYKIGPMYPRFLIFLRETHGYLSYSGKFQMSTNTAQLLGGALRRSSKTNEEGRISVNCELEIEMKFRNLLILRVLL